MDYLPIFFKISQKQCLVVGGGDVALRKINLLLKSGAIVECIAPSFCQALLKCSADNALTLTKKTFEAVDIQNQSLLISATDNEAY